MYSQIVKDHALNPRNRRTMTEPDVVGEGKFPRCGDKVKLYLRFHEDRISEATFQASACGPAVAAASLATTMVVGLSLEEARQTLVAELPRILSDLPVSKRHAIFIVLECLVQILEHENHQT